MAHNFEESFPLICTQNDLKDVRFVHQISFDNFSIREEAVQSDIFSPPGQVQPQFYLKFYPNSSSCASIYLTLASTNIRFNFKAEFKSSIIDSQGQMRKSEDKNYIFRKENESIILFSVNRNDLLNNDNGYLVANKLTIRCEICCYLDYNTQEIIEPREWKADRLAKSIQQSLFTDLDGLLESGKLSDVTLVAGGKEFHVHKNILTTRSSVFAAMFKHETKEKLQNRVEITDVEKDVLESLLHFVYSGKIASIDQLEDKLLVAADKYGLDQLKAVCEDALSTKVTPESASYLLVLADMHNAPNLKAKALDYFEKNAQEAIRGLFANNKAGLLVEAFRNIAKNQSNNEEMNKQY